MNNAPHTAKARNDQNTGAFNSARGLMVSESTTPEKPNYKENSQDGGGGANNQPMFSGQNQVHHQPIGHGAIKQGSMATPS